MFTATFDPLDITEVSHPQQIEEAADYAVSFRRTLKLRLILAGERPAIRLVRAETPGIWRRQDLDLLFGCGRSEPTTWDGWATAYRGLVLGIISPEGGLRLEPRWQLRTEGRPQGLRLAVLCAHSPSPHDATIVTVHTPQGTFSFCPAEVTTEAPLCLPDFGVYIASPDGPSYEEYSQRLATLRRRSL